MRLLVPLVMATAACYRPSLDHERCVRCGANAECPGDLACVAGICGGAASCADTIDGSSPIDDGSGADGTPGQDCSLTPFDGAPTPLSLFGPAPATFTTDAAHTVAAIKYTTDHIGLAPTATWGFSSIISDGINRNHAPKLSPEGDEIFLQTDIERRLELSFRVAYRSGSIWSAPQPLTVRDNNGVPISLNSGDFPGTPTAFGGGPRLMMFLKETETHWIELSESSRGESWDQVRSYTSATFALKRLYHPQLLAHGLVVVFVGEDLTGAFAIYAALRLNRAHAFDNTSFVVKLREGMVDGNAHPFLTADCRRLYYNDLQNGIVMLENP